MTASSRPTMGIMIVRRQLLAAGTRYRSRDRMRQRASAIWERSGSVGINSTISGSLDLMVVKLLDAPKRWPVPAFHHFEVRK